MKIPPRGIRVCTLTTGMSRARECGHLCGRIRKKTALESLSFLRCRRDRSDVSPASRVATHVPFDREAHERQSHPSAAGQIDNWDPSLCYSA